MTALARFPVTRDILGMSESTGIVEQRITASIDNWKRKLLDLSKRNRTLNFKMNKVSTIAIVDEQPAEVFRQLCLKNEGMRFKSAPEKPARADSASEKDDREASSSGNLIAHATEPALDPAAEAATPLDEEDEEVQSFDFTPKESADSNELFKAPLVLVPVELTRRSARSGYVLKATDDDPLVNPALTEYLRRGFGITLPELPDSSTISDDYDLQTFFKAVGDTVATQKEWAVKTDIYLGLFSFQKFVMYKDLETNPQALTGHRLIRQLITRSGTQIGGLPDDVRSMELDRDYAPEQTFQV